MANMDEPQFLRDLAQDNGVYKSLIEAFKNKLSTINGLVDSASFREAEIKRIESQFLKPMIVQARGSSFITGGFSLDGYRQKGFDWLKEGNNLPIATILQWAEAEYIDAGLQFHSREQISDFHDSILAHLKYGVAYLQYEHYLTRFQPGKPESTETFSLTDFMEPVLIPYFENTIEPKFKNGRADADISRTEYACFCDILCQKGYLIGPRRKVSSDFALFRYGTEIGSMIDAKKIKENIDQVKRIAIRCGIKLE